MGFMPRRFIARRGRRRAFSVDFPRSRRPSSRDQRLCPKPHRHRTMNQSTVELNSTRHLKEELQDRRQQCLDRNTWNSIGHLFDSLARQESITTNLRRGTTDELALCGEFGTTATRGRISMDGCMLHNKHKKESDNATRASVQNEMGKPRMSKSARVAELNLHASRIVGQPNTTVPGTERLRNSAQSKRG